MFRYERPQAGRYRQFWQWGVEAIGSPDPRIDAEVIHFTVTLFDRLGIGATEARLNSAGCPTCAPGYNDLLRKELGGRLDEFCEDCRVRYERNPRRMFDCKNERCLAVLADAPSILEALCDECAEHFALVQDLLSRVGVRYSIDESLARGLDYYTKTIFEIHHAELGAQSALCGGGRYDGLIEELGGAPTPACGVSSGVERLIAALDSEGAFEGGAPGPDVYVVTVGEGTAAASAEIAARLRERASVEVDYRGRSLSKQMKEASRLGARFAVIIGEDELARGVATVKDMGSGEQSEHPIDALADVVAGGAGAG